MANMNQLQFFLVKEGLKEREAAFQLKEDYTSPLIGYYGQIVVYKKGKGIMRITCVEREEGLIVECFNKKEPIHCKDNDMVFALYDLVMADKVPEAIQCPDEMKKLRLELEKRGIKHSYSIIGNYDFEECRVKIYHKYVVVMEVVFNTYSMGHEKGLMEIRSKAIKYVIPEQTADQCLTFYDILTAQHNDLLYDGVKRFLCVDTSKLFR